MPRCSENPVYTQVYIYIYISCKEVGGKLAEPTRIVSQKSQVVRSDSNPHLLHQPLGMLTNSGDVGSNPTGPPGFSCYLYTLVQPIYHQLLDMIYLTRIHNDCNVHDIYHLSTLHHTLHAYHLQYIIYRLGQNYRDTPLWVCSNTIIYQLSILLRT